MTAVITRLDEALDAINVALLDTFDITPPTRVDEVLAEPAPAREMIDIIRDMIGEQE